MGVLNIICTEISSSCSINLSSFECALAQGPQYGLQTFTIFVAEFGLPINRPKLFGGFSILFCFSKMAAKI